MKKVIFTAGMFALLGYSCMPTSTPANTDRADNVSAHTLHADKMPAMPNALAADDETVALRMTKHSTKLILQKNDFCRPELSAAHVNELKTWWDSLPRPLQSKVKTNEISVEVVSNIRSNGEQKIPSKLTDSQIEQTGAALERVIGAPADMTYTVNTTVIEHAKPSVLTHEELATTDIYLVATEPVKLSKFSLDLPLSDAADVNNETVQAVQYWWESLPMDLQTKIKQQEIAIQLNVCAIDRKEVNHAESRLVGANADNKALIINDILNRIIGSHRVGKRELPLAKIQSSAIIEKPNAANASIRANQYLKIQLKTQRSTAVQPSL